MANGRALKTENIEPPAETQDSLGPLEGVIAAQVKRHRLEADISAAELASRTGLSKAMISKIESASTSSSLTTLQRLAQGLNIPVTALFQGADTEREAIRTSAGPRTPSMWLCRVPCRRKLPP